MPINNNDLFFMKHGEIKINLCAKKRAIPLSLKDHRQELEDTMRVLANIDNFHNKLETRFEIRKGDIAVVQFAGSSANELSGRHFVVAISDSKESNPLVTVVPLKSLKECTELNPASDVILGSIAGILNGRESIAIVNQIKTIDKARFFEASVLTRVETTYENNFKPHSEKTFIQLKNIYRLSKEQVKILLRAVVGFIMTGYISHNNY